MSRNSIKSTETLMLRRIDPVIMLKKYLAGEFKNLTIPQSKITISNAFVNLNKIGTDYNSETYRFNDKTNSGQLIITTNHESYNCTKNKDSDKTIEQPVEYCKWCRRKIEGSPLRIPIAMEKDPITGVITFYGDDPIDKFECGLAILKRVYSCHRNYRDSLYMDSIQMLHCYYYRMYPKNKGSKIIEAKDWGLLKSNGGPLSNEEYDSNQHRYVETPNVIMLPIKRQYIKLKLKT